MGRSGGARHQFPEIAVEGVRLRLEKPSAPRDGGGGGFGRACRWQAPQHSQLWGPDGVCLCVCVRAFLQARGGVRVL